MTEADEFIKEFLDGLEVDDWVYVRDAKAFHARFTTGFEPSSFPCLIKTLGVYKTFDGVAMDELVAITFESFTPRVVAMVQTRWDPQ